jgi:hypothetical protein
MKFRKYKWIFKNWEIVAVVTASFIGLILHALGIIHQSALLISLILFLLCLYVLRDISFETKKEEQTQEIFERIKSVEARLKKSEIELVTPDIVVSAVKELYFKNMGEVWLFNMCMKMYSKKNVFEKALKPIIENPNATEIQFIVHTSEKEIWEKNFQPLLDKCKNRDKVLPPIFSEIKEPFAFQMVRISHQKDVREALLAVWGEPFMAELGPDSRAYLVRHPRYVFHIKSHSELILRLKELFMKYKLMHS